MNDRLDQLLRRWARLGAGFSVAPTTLEVDPERVLLETARLAPKMARLFIMAATWLHRYGDLIAKHRLKQLVREELEPAHRPALGLLLDIAQQGTHPLQFVSIVRDLAPLPVGTPLFEVERGTPALIARARSRASAISNRWCLWCEEFAFKDDAIRPPAFVMSTDPDLVTRADFRGDLRASILASLKFDEHAGRSELELARRCGGSRAQVRAALDNLELSGRAARIRQDVERRFTITLRPSWDRMERSA